MVDNYRQYAPAGPALPGVSIFEQVMAWFAWPMVVAGPIWMTAGHIFLGSTGGWWTFISIFTIAPAYFVVALVHAILVTIYAGRRRRWATGSLSSYAALAFIIFTVLFPFTVADAGDSGPGSPAPLTSLFGVPGSVASALLGVLLLGLISSAVVMIVADIIQLAKTPKPVAFTGFQPGHPWQQMQS